MKKCICDPGCFGGIPDRNCKYCGGSGFVEIEMEKMNYYYWDRRPGCFVNQKTGEEIRGPVFSGNTVEWYLTLLETIRDVKPPNYNILLTSPDINTIFECLIQYRPFIDAKNEYFCENCGFHKQSKDKNDKDEKLNYHDTLFSKRGILGNEIYVYTNNNPFSIRNKLILLPEDMKNPVVIEVKAMGIF